MCKLLNRESIRSKNDGIIAQRHFLDLESHGSGIVNRIQRHAKKKDGSIANFSTVWFISRRATPIPGMGFIEKVDDDIRALNAESTERNHRYLEVPYKPKTSPSESTPALWFKHLTEMCIHFPQCFATGTRCSADLCPFISFLPLVVRHFRRDPSKIMKGSLCHWGECILLLEMLVADLTDAALSQLIMHDLVVTVICDLLSILLYNVRKELLLFFPRVHTPIDACCFAFLPETSP